MISFSQSPYRSPRAVEPTDELPRWLVALVLGMILFLQIGLVLLVA